jgi:hypothetical protein
VVDINTPIKHVLTVVDIITPIKHVPTVVDIITPTEYVSTLIPPIVSIVSVFGLCPFLRNDGILTKLNESSGSVFGNPFVETTLNEDTGLLSFLYVTGCSSLVITLGGFILLEILLVEDEIL